MTAKWLKPCKLVSLDGSFHSQQKPLSLCFRFKEKTFSSEIHPHQNAGTETVWQVSVDRVLLRSCAQLYLSTHFFLVHAGAILFNQTIQLSCQCEKGMQLLLQQVKGARSFSHTPCVRRRDFFFSFFFCNRVYLCLGIPYWEFLISSLCRSTCKPASDLLRSLFISCDS